ARASLPVRHAPGGVGEDEEARVGLDGVRGDGDEDLAVGCRDGVGGAEDDAVEGPGERGGPAGANGAVEGEVRASAGHVHDLDRAEVGAEVEREEAVVVEEDAAGYGAGAAGLVGQ